MILEEMGWATEEFFLRADVGKLFCFKLVQGVDYLSAFVAEPVGILGQLWVAAVVSDLFPDPLGERAPVCGTTQEHNGESMAADEKVEQFQWFLWGQGSFGGQLAHLVGGRG